MNTRSNNILGLGFPFICTQLRSSTRSDHQFDINEKGHPDFPPHPGALGNPAAEDKVPAMLN